MMPPLDTAEVVLAGITLFAAFVNGAIGYGFSSLTVPLALIFYTNRILNPAVVLIEVFINLYVLAINRSGVIRPYGKVQFSSECCPASQSAQLLLLHFIPAGSNSVRSRSFCRSS